MRLPDRLQPVHCKLFCFVQGRPANHHNVIQTAIVIAVLRQDVDVLMPLEGSARRVLTAEPRRHLRRIADDSLVDAH